MSKRFFCPKKYKRPEIELEIFRVGNANKKRVWEIFRKYHYLNTSLHPAAEQWVGLKGITICKHFGERF